MSKLQNQRNVLKYDVDEVKFLMEQLDECYENLEPLIVDKLIVSANTLVLDLASYKEQLNEKD